jgi:hypothetical protein
MFEVLIRSSNLLNIFKHGNKYDAEGLKNWLWFASKWLNLTLERREFALICTLWPLLQNPWIIHTDALKFVLNYSLYLLEFGPGKSKPAVENYSNSLRCGLLRQLPDQLIFYLVHSIFDWKNYSYSFSFTSLRRWTIWYTSLNSRFDIEMIFKTILRIRIEANCRTMTYQNSFIPQNPKTHRPPIPNTPKHQNPKNP